jgi:hypothetical protein
VENSEQIDGRIILKLILKGLGGRGLDSCSAGYEPVVSFMNTLMKLGFFKMREISRLSERLLVSEAELCSVELDEE